MPFPIDSIITPTLLLHKERCQQNIERMCRIAAQNQLQFRPHFKTHQSHEVGQWFRQQGTDKITVSSLAMAEYFAKDGWNDITVAFPVNLREYERLQALAQHIQLNVILEDVQVAIALNGLLHHSVAAFVKIDVGARRTGLKTDNLEAIHDLVATIQQANQLNFVGFLAHAGQSYAARSAQQIQQVHDSCLQELASLKAHFVKDFPQLEISVGDTPTCSKAENWEGITEIRPGNFVFYDLMQWQIGACEPEDIAVAMACPVVAKHADRHEIVLYGGGIHLAKDHLILQNQLCYGLVTPFKNRDWEAPKFENYLRSISQEHGVAKVEASWFNRLNIGDLVAVLPVHSCMTADCMGEYLSNDGEIIEHFSKY